jgi:YD repeat-containing protein
MVTNTSGPKMKYDEAGNIIYREDSDGDVRKYKYDEEGNTI